MEFEKIFDGPVVTLDEVLDNKTSRVERRQAMLSDGFFSGVICLVSFALNIPGEVKQFPLARAAFQEGVAALHDALGELILRESSVDKSTGSEALMVVNAEPLMVKERTAAIEDTHSLGRLFDMDVLDGAGEPISRQTLGAPPRRCLICGKDAKVCGRSRAHSLDALRLEIARHLNDYFRDQAADKCACRATRALLYEVSTTPKPGLVDRNNAGSHRDMDFFTFLDSSAALSPWFREMFCIGWECSDESAETLFERLRFAGRQAERAMLSATGGVNTHKGLIFSLGLLCGAMGARQAQGVTAQNSILALCAEMGRLSLRDFQKLDEDTNGKKCFREHQLTGIRGEAAQGFPSAGQIGLPVLRQWTKAGLSLNDASAAALLALIGGVSDTNMVRRGGFKRAEERRAQATVLAKKLDTANCMDVLRELDESYIEENLSPGGCADLLAISLMLFFTEQEQS